ncbi:MAG: GGDEF domain-containing protein [Eubacteriales bacterium]|nr:GGDEF domain-containing protein [Eubacteriales bacterium]
MYQFPIIERVRESMLAGRQLFSVAKKDIARHNRKALVFSSGIGAVLCGLALVLPQGIIPGWSATGWDMALLIACCLFFLFAVVCTNREQAGYPLVQTACLLFAVTVTGLLTGVCVCSFPAAPGVAAVLAPLCAVALFILPPNVMLVYLAAAECALLFCTLQYKAVPYAGYDAYASVLTLLLSLLLLWRLFRLRVEGCRAKERYQRLSTLDALTGILNKNASEQYCKSYLSVREPEEACALMVIDIDDLKAVNDTLGHRTGDGLLEAVGSGLVGCFRSSDVVGRIGGDEFLILLKNVPNRDFLAFTARRIQKAVETVSRTHIKVQVSCSIGIAYSKRPPTSYDDLFLRADTAMFEAKKAGKHRFFIKNVN